MKESEDKATTEKLLSFLFGFFRSLKLTILLLILLATLSIIGTLISQNLTPGEYIARYGPGFFEVFDFFGLFNMYHSWWFSTILLLLVVNLIVCSAQRIRGTWRQLFPGPGPKGLEDRMLKTLPYVERFKKKPGKEGPVEDAIQPLFKRWFRRPQRIETNSAINLFGEKGRVSRLGVYVTHLSIIVILVGGLIGSRYGFTGFMNVMEGETVDSFTVRGRRGTVPKPLGFSVRCDDFSITFYDLPGQENHVKEYTSQLTILDNGKEVMKRTVEVNHPLRYQGLAFYQASYGVLNDFTLEVQQKNRGESVSLRVLEGETVPIPDSNARIRILRYAPQVHNFGEGIQVALFEPNHPPRSFWLFRGSPMRDQHTNETFALSLKGVTSKEYTGLQVAKDPGVDVVWVGCGLMILGLVVSFFFSHQKLWVRVPKDSPGQDEIILAGSTNKNRVAFEKRFRRLGDDIQSLIHEGHDAS